MFGHAENARGNRRKVASRFVRGHQVRCSSWVVKFCLGCRVAYFLRLHCHDSYHGESTWMICPRVASAKWRPGFCLYWAGALLFKASWPDTMRIPSVSFGRWLVGSFVEFAARRLCRTARASCRPTCFILGLVCCA